MKARSQEGFTIIELVVVIVLLGLLAGVALPKFVSLTQEARAATLEGVRGSFQSSVLLIHARWLAQGSAGTTVTLEDGSTVVVNAAGWPTVDGANAAQDTAQELYDLIIQESLPTPEWTLTETPAAGAGTATFTLNGAGGGAFTYDGSNGDVS